MGKRVVLGGTFNVIHKGHMALLKKAFEIGDFVFIGLTSDEMASRVRDMPVQGFDVRKRNLADVVSGLGADKKFVIEEINDVYGPAAAGDFDAIIVSEETRKGAETVNRARETAGLKPLDIIEIKMVLAEDGEKIASRRIIRGEIDKDGESK